ncbi:hypothetical protein J3R30DRAFT_1386021 [Lentinula aciculospora]|uniref:Uncharacterized protein n=1 Tax=Lentinula aciculospora TaxID=153920 RepID=A0A9W9DTE7_9AGAR|nr:hypothetical protein J3R30DRAFT_1386021 [Lentinula aciculospora]
MLSTGSIHYCSCLSMSGPLLRFGTLSCQTRMLLGVFFVSIPILPFCACASVDYDLLESVFGLKIQTCFGLLPRLVQSPTNHPSSYDISCFISFVSFLCVVVSVRLLQHPVIITSRSIVDFLDTS